MPNESKELQRIKMRRYFWIRIAFPAAGMPLSFYKQSKLPALVT